MTEHDYELTSVIVQHFTGYASVSKALRSASRWLKKVDKERQPWGITVLGIHTFTYEDGTHDVTVTVEVA